MNVGLMFFVKYLLTFLTHSVKLSDVCGAAPFLLAFLKQERSFQPRFIELRNTLGIEAFAPTSCSLSSQRNLLSVFLSENNMSCLMSAQDKLLNAHSL